ncbi:hypothetical protein PMAYCL1PPCAC_20415, partial [Pristionchus mayeri]
RGSTRRNARSPERKGEDYGAIIEEERFPECRRRWRLDLHLKSIFRKRTHFLLSLYEWTASQW